MKTHSFSHSHLTEMQHKILHFIEERCASLEPPTYRDIQSHFGFRSVGTVQGHIRSLVKKGAVTKFHLEGRKRSRGIVSAGYEPPHCRQIPIFGQVVAGLPTESEQIELGTLILESSRLTEGCFALRVDGNSMIHAHILKGDYIIVDPSIVPKSGDIVVALLEGESTVKRYIKREGRRWLVPENDALEPIEITTQSFSIQGTVIGLHRELRK